MPKSDKNRFLEELDTIGDDATAEMKDLDFDAVSKSVDWAKGSELMDNVEIGVFGENLVNAIRIESSRIFEGSDLSEQREEEQVLKVSKLAMAKGIDRFMVLTDSFEGSDISNEVEVAEFWQRVAGVMQSIDAKALLYESASDLGVNGELVSSFYESIEEQIPEDYTAVVENILTDSVDKSDREFMVAAIRGLSTRDLAEVYSESTKVVQTAQVSLLLQNLNENPAEKANVMEMLVAGPGGPEALLDLTVGGYLSVAESEILISDTLYGETDLDRIEAFEEVQNFVLGDTMESVNEMRVEAQREIATRMSYTIGHKNQAASKLTYKGIAGTYIKLIATTGILMNILANWEHPINGIMLNPMIAASLAVGSVGAYVDPSDIGAWPKPGTDASKLLQDGEDLDEAEEGREYDAFKKDMLGHPRETELFYNLNDEIVDDARAQMTAGASLREVDITMDSLGVDYGKLPPRFKGVSQENIEKRFTDWIQTFMFDEGLNLDSARAQKDYLNTARDESELLNGDWEIYPSISNAL